ncbi:hypothetical protein OIU76_020515 [Salix suchowensis]|nr:hypothetical protein OIU76_020515 [Salix suchowensis]
MEEFVAKGGMIGTTIGPKGTVETDKKILLIIRNSCRIRSLNKKHRNCEIKWETLAYLFKAVPNSNINFHYLLSIMVWDDLQPLIKIEMGDSLCKKLLNHYQANDGSECSELFDASPSIAWQKLGNPMRNSDGIPPIKSVQRTLLFISSNYWKPVTRRLTAIFHCSAAVM